MTRRWFSLPCALLLAACSSPAASPAPAVTASPGPVATATPNLPSPPGSPTPMPSEAAPSPWVVFQWLDGDRDTIFLVRPDGSERHQLLPGIRDVLLHPDWSPDGTLIAFERLKDDGTNSVWTATAEGKDATELVACVEQGCRQVFYPAWSPDGRSIAYARYDDPDGDGSVLADRLSIEVMDLATRERRVVARAPAVGADYQEYLYPRWSGDSKSIVFTITHYSNPPQDPLLGSEIAIVAADGSMVDAPKVLTAADLFGAYADWSRTEDVIVFTTYDLSYFQDAVVASNLYSIRPDATGLEMLTNHAAGGLRVTQPTWAPDGRRILVTLVQGSRQVGWCTPDGACEAASSLGSATHPRLQPFD